MMNKKAVMSLRTIVFIIIFSITTATGFIYWAYDGTSQYDVTISPEFNDSFANITSNIDVIHNNSQEVMDTLQGLSNDINVQTIIGVPDAMLTVLKLPFNYVIIFWNVTNEFAKVLHIPGFILFALEAAILLLLGYLLMDAVLRLKNS